MYSLSFDKNVTHDFPTIDFIKESGSFLTGGGNTTAQFWILQKLGSGFKKKFFLVLLKDPLFTFGKRSSRIQTKQVFTIWFTWFCMLNVAFLHQFPNKCYFANSPRQKQWLYPFKWFFFPSKKTTFWTLLSELHLDSVNLERSPQKYNSIFSVNRPPLRIVYLCLHFKLNILVFYLLLLFCLKVYERWNSWTTSVHFYMALHLFLYVFFKCWIGSGRRVWL